MSKTPRRLQLGTSALENLDSKVLSIFLDNSWVHLGDNIKSNRITIGGFFKWYCKSIFYLIKNRFWGSSIKCSRLKGNNANYSKLYEQTNFIVYFYKKEWYLPFQDESFDYIFSEHFFEHLFSDEALALFQECYRVLKPNCVIRTCVPDADLRIYEPPESVGFPKKKMGFAHPLKHKTRWSVYSLKEVLRLAGFDPIPLHYCDKFGEYFHIDPLSIREKYCGCKDEECAFDLTHIRRLKSLIVDGVKKC